MPTINKRFLLRLLLVFVLVAGALVGAHTIQAGRIPTALKAQADRAAANGKPAAAAQYLRRYLEFRPDDVAVRAELAGLLKSHGGSPAELYHLYEKVLRADPGRTEERRAAVDVCLRMGRYTDAAEHAEKYLETTPADTAVRMQRALATAALGRTAETLATFESALRYAPQDATIYRRYLAYLTADLNRPDDAKPVVDRMVAALPDSPEPYLARARLALHKSDAVPGPAVLADANRALSLDPKNAEALILQAECLQRARDVAGARDSLAAGLREYPGDVRFVKRLAWLELNRGNPGRAVALLEDGLKAARDGFEDLLVPLGDLLVQQGETARADEIIRTLENRKSPIAPIQAQYLKARMRVHEGKWSEATTLLTVVRTGGQSYPGLETQANLLLALCHRQLGETERERECLKLILDRDPRHGAARVTLAQSYLNAGQFADALREFEDAARSPFASGSTAAMVVRLRGLKVRGTGRAEEWAMLDRAAVGLTARFGSGSSEPAELRADLFHYQGKPDRALTVLRQEAARRPGNAGLWARVVDETAALFGTAAGFQVLDEALALAGDGPELRLARALLAAKDPARLRPVELSDVHPDTWAEADRVQYYFGLVEIYDRLGDAPNLARVRGLATRLKPSDPSGNPTDACLDQAKQKLRQNEPESAAALFERAVRLDPVGVIPAREYLTFLAQTGADTKLAQYLARLNNDPRWFGDPVRRVVTTACLQLKPDGVRRLLTAAEKQVGADPKTCAWVGDAYATAGMKAEAVLRFEVAASAPFASADDYLRLALAHDITDPPNATLTRAKEKLQGSSYWTFRAAEMNLPARQGLFVGLQMTPADHFALTQAQLALHLSQDRRADAISGLEAALQSKKLPPDQIGWAKRTLGMLLADRGNATERKKAFDLFVTDPVTAGTTPDEKRTTAAVLASLARYLDGSDRTAALARSSALLVDVIAAHHSPRDQFLRYQVLRVLGDSASRNEARSILNSLIDPKAPNLDYLIAGLSEVGEGTTDAERTQAESFASQLRTAFPGDFRAVAAVSRYDARNGRTDAALALVDAYVRMETGPADAQNRAARAADLLDGIARHPVWETTPPSPIVPVAGVDRTPPSDRRRLVDSAVARYEGLIPVRPEAAAAAAALLAFDGRTTDAFALVAKYPALPLRLRAAAGVAIVRAGPVTEAQLHVVKSHLDAARTAEPDSLAVRLTTAEFLAHQKDYTGAEKVYDDVLAAAPTNVVALNNLAWLLAPNPAQSAKALGLLARAVDQSGLTPELLDTRARIRIAARQCDLAEKDAQDALTREPTPLRYFHLALARQSANPPKAAEAIEAFRRAKSHGLAPYMVHPADLGALRAFDSQ